jgi:hypothetical protein
MDKSIREEVGKGFNLVKMIGFAMVGSLMMLTAIVEIISRGVTTFEGYAPFPAIAYLRYALIAVAVADLLIARVIWKKMAAGSGSTMISETLRRLSTAAIIPLAICCSIGIYGLVLFLLGGSTLDFYLFLGLALVGFGIYFPRFEQWERELSFREDPETGHNV